MWILPVAVFAIIVVGALGLVALVIVVDKIQESNEPRAHRWPQKVDLFTSCCL